MRSLSRSMSQTGRFMKRQMWLWPLVAIGILALVGLAVRHAIETTMKENLRSQLTTLLSVETAMLENWFDDVRRSAEASANDPDFRKSIYRLLGSGEGDPSSSAEALDDVRKEDARKEDARKELANVMAIEMAAEGFNGFFVCDRQRRIVASSYPMLVGQEDIPPYDRFLEQVLNGETVVSTPFPSAVMMKDHAGDLRTGVPTMYACAPIRDTNFRVIGALALQLRPEAEFTEILQLGRIGNSGETYAFDAEGVMVSNSRFDHDLILLGILPDQPNVRSILNVHLRDPGGDMTRGFRPTVRRSKLPLTPMVAQAVTGRSGVDVEGYRDYRGVMVIGAWKWLPELQLGVATEIDQAEAFRPLTILRRTFYALYAMLIACAVAILVFSFVVARLRRRAAKAAIEAQRLGQYTLEEKIGEGAMGVVYKGHHAMLRRPTAIKMLDVDKVTDVAIERFEHEVQITCQLAHPSTIVIYDYGRTPEGVFYYAMEYLDGVDLQSLVQSYGPQPPGRVIRMLMQVCGSLHEAHANGLVHRDIKPANVMLNRRGGEPDVVKVLDFGLVKQVDEMSTSGGGLTGTPLYMSPEAIETPMAVDHRSDLYSVGAVAYFLLTGQLVFEADGLAELCRKHVDERPIPPSKRVGKEFSKELEYAVLACLEKSRAKRPQTARDLANLLKRCPEADTWTVDDAEAWWLRHERGEVAAPQGDDDDDGSNDSSGYDQTIARDA